MNLRWGTSLGCAALSFILGAAQSPAQAFDPPADTRPRADIIFLHANVYTGVPSNTPFSSILREEAIAVRGDRIEAVGKTLDLQKLKGSQTQIVDLGGHFTMAGFNDAHLHLDDAGAKSVRRPAGCRSKFQFNDTGIREHGGCRWPWPGNRCAAALYKHGWYIHIIYKCGIRYHIIS